MTLAKYVARMELCTILSVRWLKNTSWVSCLREEMEGICIEPDSCRAFSETKWKSGQTWKIGKIGARSELHQKKVKNLGNI